MIKEDQKGWIAWMAKNPVAANLGMLFFIFGGIFGLQHITQEVFPQFDLDTVTVSVAYPGASPEEVEDGIVKPVEEAILGLEGIKKVRSTASEGNGLISIELLEGENLQKLETDVRSAVARIRTFPDDAEEPITKTIIRKRQVIALVLYGKVDKKILHHYAEMIRNELLINPDITQVDISGLPSLEISIQVPKVNLRRYNLSIDEIAKRVKAASINLPFGGIKTKNGEILLRMTERCDYGKQFSNLPIITTEDGSEILLKDIATIDDGFEDTDYHATFNNKPAVMVNIYRIGKQTPISVSKAVKKSLEKLQTMLPNSIKIEIMRDRSEIFEQRLDLLLRNACLGLVLVFLLLGIFLHINLAFWVMLGIPISFLGSLLLLPGTSLSINLVSLFAYIIALGIVVDDAIVVGENIYFYRERNIAPLEASIKGTLEIATPVTFSILTNIVAFMPLYFVPGVMGKIFRQIPIVVVTVFAISLVESLFVLPAHLGHQKEKKNKGRLYMMQQKFSDLFMTLVRLIYVPILKACLRYRYIAVSMAFAILVVAISLGIGGYLGFQMFPKVESDRSEVTVVMPYGTAIEKSSALADKLVIAAQKVQKGIKGKYVQGIYAKIGDGGSHNIKIQVYLVDADARKKIGVSTQKFTERWRKAAGKILGTESIRFASDAGGPGHGAAVTVELTHTDIQVLKKASSELASMLSEIEYTCDIDDGFALGKQQLNFHILPEGKSLGFSAASIGRAVRNAYYGAEVTRQLRGRDEIKIIVRLPKKERVTEYDLHELIIDTSDGKEIMLRDVATWIRGRAYTSIERRDGARIIEVTADVVPRKKTQEVLEKIKSEIFPKLMAKYKGLGCSFEGRQAERRDSINSLKFTFILALAGIYFLIAIPFKSYVQPLIVISAIPFGIVGAVVGHIIMGYSLCLPSICGIVALSGVVVNDSLVLVDVTNNLRLKSDKSLKDILIYSAVKRFRPIMLTTLTTFFGLFPMIFETSRQARFLIPIGISLGFGVLFATIITLGLVPCLYLMIEDTQNVWKKFMYFLSLSKR